MDLLEILNAWKRMKIEWTKGASPNYSAVLGDQWRLRYEALVKIESRKGFFYALSENETLSTY